MLDGVSKGLIVGIVDAVGGRREMAHVVVLAPGRNDHGLRASRPSSPGRIFLGHH